MLVLQVAKACRNAAGLAQVQVSLGLASAAHTWPTSLLLGLNDTSHARQSYSRLARVQNTDVHLQTVVDGLHDQLRSLSIPRKFIERIARKRLSRAPQLATAEGLLERIHALWAVTQADTLHKQQAVIKSLYHVPQLLSYQPDTLKAKAAALQAVLLQQGLSSADVQQLISKQPAVLTFHPQTVASKVWAMCQQLSRPATEVCSMWMRQRTLINLSSASFTARLQQLVEMLSLQPGEVAIILEQFPAVAASNMATVQQRFAAIQECLPQWSKQQLGQGLMSYASVLTYSADTIRHKWAVVTAYAELHPASRQQLDSQLHKAVILNLFTRQANRFQLLQYIMQLHPSLQQQPDVISKGSSSGKRSKTAHRQQEANEQLQELPLILVVLNYSNSNFKSFVDSAFEGFWDWQHNDGQVVHAGY